MVGATQGDTASKECLLNLRIPQKGDAAMMLEFTVGINIDGERQSVTVSAEDALIAALKVKHEKPEAIINYVRRSNRRGDPRHPHKSLVAATR
jgi:hypothetical protein